MQEAMEKLKKATQEIKSSFNNTISFTAGCDLFLRFVTRTFHDATVNIYILYYTRYINFVIGF
jgi:translation initiation factor eIF-2B subunit alpha